MPETIHQKTLEAQIKWRDANFTFRGCPCCDGKGRVAVLMSRLVVNTDETQTADIEYQRCKYCRGYANGWVHNDFE